MDCLPQGYIESLFDSMPRHIFNKSGYKRLRKNVSIMSNCWQQWSQEGTISRKPGSNHVRITTDSHDHYIHRMTVQHRSASAAETTAFVGIKVRH
ncbi:hypothetical protein TNCV_3040131 [Trichonephila clavipes]|nr:hypothetical protein TNCV_3040131 [Trichonephila clavipes]